MKTNSRVKSYAAYGEIRRRRELNTIKNPAHLSDRSLLTMVGIPPYQFLREFYNL